MRAATWRSAVVGIAAACGLLAGCGNGADAAATKSSHSGNLADEVSQSAGADETPAAAGSTPEVTAADEAVPTDANGDPIDLSRKGTRDATSKVLVPVADGKVTYGGKNITIDASHTEDGYVEVCYRGAADKVKIQITPPNGNTYTYDVTKAGEYEVFPLSCGDGDYKIGVYTNIQDNMYATEYETTLTVKLSNEYTAFLYPNQLVWFTKNTKAVSTAAEVVVPADTDLEAVSLIYDYVIHHMTYDWDKAATVKSGYIPDVDKVLASGKGICFDYASLLTAMLRSQRIPTRMEIGYAGTAYHAWVSTYIQDIGWVNGIIRFDGTDWELMDPTLATTETEKNYKDFIQAGDNYQAIYLY